MGNRAANLNDLVASATNLFNIDHVRYWIAEAAAGEPLCRYATLEFDDEGSNIHTHRTEADAIASLKEVGIDVERSIFADLETGQRSTCTIEIVLHPLAPVAPSPGVEGL